MQDKNNKTKHNKLMPTNSSYPFPKVKTGTFAVNESLIRENINTLIKLIIELISLLDQGNLPPEACSICAPSSIQSGTGTSNKLGWYLLYNKVSKKFYVGCSANLSLRKADYNRAYRDYLNNTSRVRLYNCLISDFEETGREPMNMVFIPVLVYDLSRNQTNLLGLESLTGSENISPKTRFLEAVELPVIRYFLDNEKFNKKLLNLVDTGSFQTGNTLGGSPGSGSPPVCLAETTGGFAFGSRSTLANVLGVDRNSVDLRQNKGEFQVITEDEFNGWPKDKKITVEQWTSNSVDQEVIKLLRQRYPKKPRGRPAHD